MSDPEVLEMLSIVQFGVQLPVPDCVALAFQVNIHFLDGSETKEGDTWMFVTDGTEQTRLLLSLVAVHDAFVAPIPVPAHVQVTDVPEVVGNIGACEGSVAVEQNLPEAKPVGSDVKVPILAEIQEPFSLLTTGGGVQFPIFNVTVVEVLTRPLVHEKSYSTLERSDRYVLNLEYGFIAHVSQFGYFDETVASP